MTELSRAGAIRESAQPLTVSNLPKMQRELARQEDVVERSDIRFALVRHWSVP